MGRWIKNVGIEFKKFALRGNVVDLAVGIIIGASFNGVVKSIVEDIVMPPIGFALGRVDFSNLFIVLGSEKFATVAEAKMAGAATINYGLFINTLISFLITAWVVFMLVKLINLLHEKQDKKDAKNPPVAPTPEDVLILREIRDSLKR